MNKKISLGIAISLIAVACAVTFVVTMTASLNLYNDKIAGVQQREEINTRIQEIDSFVRNYSLSAVDDESVKSGIYAGYLDGISDRYSDYYTTDEYYYETMLESGVIVSLGIETVNDGGYPKVAKVYKNSPAEEAGITKDDIISKVNGQNVLEIGYKKASELILFGDEGTKTTLLVRHNGEEIEHSLSRTSFEISSVKHELLDNGIFYIGVSDIHNLTGKQVGLALEEHATEEIKGYIFDLRECESGNYSSAAEILDPFIPKMTIANAVYKNNSYQVIGETSDDKSTALPISVMVNEKTGGSAELIALCLRGGAAAKIVGTPTMGYGTLQEARAFSDGTAVKISVAVIEPAAEAGSYNETGVKPEFIVEYAGITETAPGNYVNTYDVQYKKAVEVVLSAMGGTSAEEQR
ncbi:MAG: PDZ domain-containing protein [Ruminiclostridium sp.]|nr:PDZ domain-containing protein [Ruminiclostridium sp.]